MPPNTLSDPKALPMATKFVFWQNMVSMIMFPFLRALARRGCECVCVADRIDLPERTAMGWETPQSGDVRVVAEPDETAMRSILEHDPRETIHVFGGFRGCRTAAFAWNYCLKHPRHVGIVAETGDPRGWKGLLRRIYYRTVGLRQGRRVDFVLAMGQNGVSWYKHSGFAPNRVFPFTYTVETEGWDLAGAVRDDLRFQILYLGTLDARKAPDLLLRAVQRLPPADWVLRLVGDGPLRPQLESFVRTTNLGDRVDFLGYRPHQEALRVLVGCDLLVVPSRHDGWGAIVNEALTLGVPVVCSDRCGAADIVRHPSLGEVYSWRDIDGLSKILQRRIAAGPTDATTRERLKMWSRCIEGPAVADYFLAVVEHVYRGGPCPMPPWHRPFSRSASSAHPHDPCRASAVGTVSH